MAASAAQVLAPGVGWGVVIGLAVGFSFLMLSDHLSSRSVKPGLIAAGIVSAWTWAATLEQSAVVGYKYGVSGPFWYAAGATIQVLLFAIVGSNTKLNAPFANTWLQIIRARWGKLAHCVFILFALATNTLVSSMLILGGSDTVNLLTGMPTLAACFITPLGIAVYVVLGGLRASFIADYLHTTVLCAIILAFAFVVYGASDKIGSFSKMKELLDAAPAVEGNAEGSYLTMRSLNGLLFGIINVCGNFGTIFADQSYFQRAAASRGETATKGFILGGMAWLAVPLLIASSLGLAARALEGVDSDMAILTADQVSAGLPGPAAAAALMGKSGAAAMLILLFLAVTSAASAQLVAVSSILTFDVYQPYIKPSATAKELYFVSHVGVLIWALFMGVLGLIWYYIGISLGWIYTMMGIVIGPAVFPIFGCTAWSKANKTSGVVSAIVGSVVAVVSWIASTASMEGTVTIDSTSSNYPLIIGNLIAILLPVVIMVPWSLMYPDNYDWEETRAINAPWKKTGSHADEGAASDSAASGTASPDEKPAALPASGSGVASDEKNLPTVEGYDKLDALTRMGMDPEKLLASRRLAINWTIALSFILIIVVPAFAVIPKVWTAAGLGVWISIAIAWMFCTVGVVVLYPIYESRQALGRMLRGIVKDITTFGGGKATAAE